MENKKRLDASTVTAPNSFSRLVTTDTSEQQRKASYRIVFTMKRTITARPTQPHITPITIAVTSPAAQKHAGRQ